MEKTIEELNRKSNNSVLKKRIDDAFASGVFVVEMPFGEGLLEASSFSSFLCSYDKYSVETIRAVPFLKDGVVGYNYHLVIRGTE